ncbi:MAG: hypothetical protein WA989_17500, partial [Henriciella sp.]
PAPAPTVSPPPPPEQGQSPILADGLKPLPGAPRMMTGSDDRPALPRRRLETAPVYSVQSMELLPGDYEATAGYLDPTANEDDSALDRSPPASDD